MNNDQLRRFIGQDFYSDQSAAITKKVGSKLANRTYNKLDVPIWRQMHFPIYKAIQNQK